MTIFGTSAYMKLLALNPQPRDTELRDRLWPTRGGGYDFHKAMRQIATEFAGGTADWLTTRARLKAIKNPAERKSATSAAFSLVRWIDGRPIRLLNGTEQKTFSPNKIFSVKFSPDFEIDIEGVPTRIHIWNTKKPPIKIREAVGALGLFASEEFPWSLGVLSLRTGELFVASDHGSARDLAQLLAIDIEKRFTRISEERGETTWKKRPDEKRAGR